MAGGRRPWGERHLVITADDFGRSASINEAVGAASAWGVLTAASIVAAGDAFEEAVVLARRYPGLSVGLHVMLSDGRPVLSPADVPGLVNENGRFDESPVNAGIAYWMSRKEIGEQVEAEVKAQFDKVEKAGISPTHVDCHHHLQMHPLLFSIIAKEAARRGVPWIRVPREPFCLVTGLHAWRCDIRPLLLWSIFGLLASRHVTTADRHGLKYATNVYGLSGTGRISEKYLLALLPYIKGAVSEVYVHPDLGSASGRDEAKAITSALVRDRLKELRLHVTGFRELSELSHLQEDSITHAH